MTLLSEIKVFENLVKRYSYSPLLITLVAILSAMALNHGDTTLGSPTIHVVFTALKNIAGLLTLFFFLLKSKKESDSNSLLLCISYALFLIFDFDVITPSSILLILSFFIFCICSKDEKIVCFELYRYFMIITGFVGIICYLSFILHLALPYTLVPYYVDYGTGIAEYYANYNISYLCIGSDGVRLCGLYNEPGRFGTVGALYLIADDFNLRRRGNVILFIASLLTGSLAFIFLSIGFFVLSNFYKPKRIIIAICAVAFVLFFLIATNIISTEFLSHLLGRFEIVDGKLVGDNRSNDYLDEISSGVMDYHKEQFYWGYGKNHGFDFGNVGSYKTYIVQYGFVGSLILWSSLFLASCKQEKPSFLMWCFILFFFISIYQRPNVFTLYYYVALFGGLEYMYKNVKIKKNQKLNKL